MSLQTEKIRELVEKRAQARLGGGEKAIEKQHAKGKLTQRANIYSSQHRPRATLRFASPLPTERVRKHHNRKIGHV